MNAYARRKPMIEAAETLRQITVVTFPHIGGDSKDPKVAARQAARTRRRIVQDLQRKAQGLSRWDAVEGVDMLHTAADVRGWLGQRGIAA